MYVKTPTVYDGVMPKPKVEQGYILYALFLPLIGLFLERYAYSAVVAIILWALVLILMPLSCLLDKRMLDRHEVNTITLGKSFLFPPIYIYKRQVLVGGEAMLCVACATLCIGAILTNGFIKGLRINTDSVNDMVQNTAVTQLDNFSGQSVDTIGECINAYSQSEVKWSTEKQSYGFEITAQGTHGSKDFELIIRLEFDGFAYHEFKITDVMVGGEKLDKDGREDFYNACFIDYKKSKDDSSSSQSDSSK